jgi:hypothetical protein
MVRALLSEVNDETRSQRPKSEHGVRRGGAAFSPVTCHVVTTSTYYPAFGFMRPRGRRGRDSAHFRAVGHDVRVSSPEEPTERDVLSSLPRTRPQRRSAKRDGVARAGRAGAAKRSAKAGAAKPPGSTAKARTPSAKAATKPAGKPASAAPKRPSAQPPSAESPRSVEPPSRTDVLAGTVQAAGELVQAGLAVGGELLRVAISRLPRP